jgi:protein-S-isoprenylcysteine O-methyltransferase Ste14
MQHDGGPRPAARSDLRADPQGGRGDDAEDRNGATGSEVRSPSVGFGGRLLGWRRRTGPLTQRLAEQGLLLFRWRSYFGLILLPGAVLAVLGRRSAEPRLADSLWYFGCCVGVALIGLAIRFAALAAAAPGTSGRDTREPRAKTLNTTGLYSVVRHPIYLGNLVVLVAFTMTLRVAWFVALAVLVYWLLYERVIAAEERFLAERFGERFRVWAAVTPVFLPDFGRYKAPSKAVEWRVLLRKEHNSLCIIAWMLLALRLFERTVAARLPFSAWTERDLWVVAVLAGAVLATEVYRHWVRGHRRRTS